VFNAGTVSKAQISKIKPKINAIDRSSHIVYDLKYHLAWTTKYPKYPRPILKGEIAARLRELIREICRSNDVEILRVHEKINLQF